MSANPFLVFAALFLTYGAGTCSASYVLKGMDVVDKPEPSSVQTGKCLRPFCGPSAVVLDGERNVWISEAGTLRVVMPSGASLIVPVGPKDLHYSIAPTRSGIVVAEASGNVLRFQTLGTSNPNPVEVGQISSGASKGPSLETNAGLNREIGGIAVRPDGGYYVSDTEHDQVLSVSNTGETRVVVGSKELHASESSPDRSAILKHPSALALDSSGNLYIADTGNNSIKLLRNNGTIETLKTGFITDPSGVAVDDLGNVFVSDTGNNRILILGEDGSVRTIAGGNRSRLTYGIDESQLSAPLGIYFDLSSHSLLVADSGNNRICRLFLERGLSPTTLSVVNAATLLPGAVSPCSLVTVFSQDLVGAYTHLAIDNTEVNVIASATNQVSVQIPCYLSGRQDVTLAIMLGRTVLSKTTVSLTAVAPGVFARNSGTGQAVATNSDGELNSQQHPLSAGSSFTVWATGFRVDDDIVAFLGHSPLKLISAAADGNLNGVLVLRLQSQEDLSGPVPLKLRVSGIDSQDGVTLETMRDSMVGKSELENSRSNSTNGQNALKTKNVTAAPFTVAVKQPHITLKPGKTVVVSIAVISQSTYTGSVTPGIEGSLPAGVSASPCAPAKIKGSGSCLLTLTATADAGPIGPTQLSVSGRDANIISSTAIDLTILTFALAIKEQNLHLQPGGSADITVLVTAPATYLGEVVPSVVSPVPSGMVSTQCRPAIVRGSGSCVLTISAPTTIGGAGAVSLQVSGTDGISQHSSSTALILDQAPVGGASISVLTTPLALGTTVNLSAAKGWVLFAAGPGGTDYSGQRFDCVAGRVYRTDNPCNPGAFKRGGSGITPLYGTNIVSGDPRVYENDGPNITAVRYVWTDSEGPRPSGTASQAYMLPANGFEQVSFESDPVKKTATIYLSSWNYYRRGNGCYSAAASIHVTIRSEDNSFPTQTVPVSSHENDCSGYVSVQIVYSTTTHSYITVSVDQDRSQGGSTALMAATLDGPLTGSVTRIVPQTIEAYGAVFAASPGETLQFAANYTYDTFNSLVLPTKPITLDKVGNPLPIVLTSQLSLDPGVRVQLTDRATLPKFSSHSSAPVLVIGTGSNYFHFNGLDFESQNDKPGQAGLIYRLIQVAPTELVSTTDVTSLPIGIEFDHCIIRGRENVDERNPQFNQKVGIQMDGRQGQIRDSNITNWIYQTGGKFEAQAVLITVGKDIVLDNNEISANGEAVMIYCSSYSDAEAVKIPAGGGLQPDGTILRNNWIYKPYGKWVGFTYVKNLIEHKNGRGTHAYNNLLENSFEGVYSQGQHGVAMVAQNRTGVNSGTVGAPWAATQNVEFDHNIIHHVGACFQVAQMFDDVWDPGTLAKYLASGRVARSSNVKIHDNFCDDISGPIYNNYSPNAVPSAPSYPGIGLRGNGVDNFTFQRNTMLGREKVVGDTMPAGSVDGVPYASYKVTYEQNAGGYLSYPLYGYSFVKQVIDSNVFGFDIKCDATGRTDCFTRTGPASQYTFTNNLLLNVDSEGWRTGLAALDSSNPGHFSTNTFNTVHLSSQGADVVGLISRECAIRTGNRQDISCKNPDTPIY